MWYEMQTLMDADNVIYKLKAVAGYLDIREATKTTVVGNEEVRMHGSDGSQDRRVMHVYPFWLAAPLDCDVELWESRPHRRKSSG